MTMHRPTLTEHPDGLYRPLDRQIEDRLRPVEAKPDRWSWLRTTGYFAITALISVFTMAGIVLAFVFVGLFAVLAAVPWGIWKLRRDWR